MNKNRGNLVLITGAFLILLISGLFFFSRPQPTTAPSKTSNQPISTQNSTINWKTYINTTYKYSVKYPNDWSIVDSGGKQDRITFSSSKIVDGSPALISIYVRKTKNLNSQWQEEYKPFYAIKSKQKSENTYILRASSYEEGTGISKDREKLAVEVFNLMFSSFKFTE